MTTQNQNIESSADELEVSPIISETLAYLKSSFIPGDNLPLDTTISERIILTEKAAYLLMSHVKEIPRISSKYKGEAKLPERMRVCWRWGDIFFDSFRLTEMGEYEVCNFSNENKCSINLTGGEANEAKELLEKKFLNVYCALEACGIFHSPQQVLDFFGETNMTAYAKFSPRSDFWKLVPFEDSDSRTFFSKLDLGKMKFIPKFNVETGSKSGL